jgi:Putative auto-transporter adhesin, head GIN domain
MVMRKITYIVVIITLFACSNENANDCFQTSGNLIQQEIEVPPFDKILVNEGIEMIISEELDHKVIVETGSNLLNDIKVEIKNNQLILSNNNTCNFVRNYKPAKIYVTAPNISEIRSSTQFDIRSEGVLTYPQLHILSEDYKKEYVSIGDFYLTINNQSFSVTFNNLSNCFVSGATDQLIIGYFAGNSRFEGADLTAKNVDIFHRSSNDIIIYPTETLKGDIYSTGNIIALYEPPSIEVTEHYKGKLILKN